MNEGKKGLDYYRELVDNRTITNEQMDYYRLIKNIESETGAGKNYCDQFIYIIPFAGVRVFHVKYVRERNVRGWGDTKLIGEFKMLTKAVEKWYCLYYYGNRVDDVAHWKMVADTFFISCGFMTPKLEFVKNYTVLQKFDSYLQNYGNCMFCGAIEKLNRVFCHHCHSSHENLVAMKYINKHRQRIHPHIIAAINTIEDPYDWGPQPRIKERDDIQPQEQFFNKNAIDRILVRNKGGFGEVQDWMYEYADKLYNYEGVEYPIPSCTYIIKND